MDAVDGWKVLLERVGPALVLPVGSALAVTLIWALTGWGWFDPGPWPWALGAAPVALLATARVLAASQRHAQARDALDEVFGGLRALGLAAGDQAGVARVAVRLVRARLGGSGSIELGELVDADTLARIRDARDPLAGALEVLAERVEAGPVLATRQAIGRCDALATRDDSFVLSGALTLLYLVSLPVGLVTTTGWWTFAAVAGVSIAFLALEATANGLDRPFGPGRPTLPVDALAASVERSLD